MLELRKRVAASSLHYSNYTEVHRSDSTRNGIGRARTTGFVLNRFGLRSEERKQLHFISPPRLSAINLIATTRTEHIFFVNELVPQRSRGNVVTLF